MGNSSFYQIAFRGRWKFPQVSAIANFAMKKIFYWVDGNLTRSNLDYLNLFSKLKTIFCKYRTLIKVKINMT